MEAIIDYLNSHLYMEMFPCVTRSHLIKMQWYQRERVNTLPAEAGPEGCTGGGGGLTFFNYKIRALN